MLPDPEANKRTVLAFYEDAVNRRDSAAAERLLGPVYIQHRSDAADGADGLREFIGRMRARHPHSHTEIKQVFADGDHVILHVHVVREPGQRGSAHVDIFRLDQGKIVEHWDVDAPIPATSAHSNGPF